MQPSGSAMSVDSSTEAEVVDDLFFLPSRSRPAPASPAKSKSSAKPATPIHYQPASAPERVIHNESAADELRRAGGWVARRTLGAKRGPPEAESPGSAEHDRASQQRRT